MKKINPGLTYELEELVTFDKSAHHIGSGNLEVYSTPSMIALIEKTSLRGIEAFLEKDESSVGGKVNVLHLLPTAIGKRVVCKSTVISIKHNRIEFEVVVFENDKLVGKGAHTRFIIDKASFMAKL